MPKRPAILLRRVSTGRQAKKGVSLKVQRRMGADHCRLKNLQLVGVFTEPGTTGFRLPIAKRPVASAAIARAKELKAVLIFYSLSRVARDTRELINLSKECEAAGVDLLSLTEPIDTASAIGRLFYRLIASLAEFYSDRLGEDIAAAMAYKKAARLNYAGRWPPFGYDRRGDALFPNRKEHSAIRAMRRRRRDLGWSYRRIAAWLNDRQVRTKGGRKWQPSVVRKLIDRKLD